MIHSNRSYEHKRKATRRDFLMPVQSSDEPIRSGWWAIAALAGLLCWIAIGGVLVHAVMG